MNDAWETGTCQLRELLKAPRPSSLLAHNERTPVRNMTSMSRFAFKICHRGRGIFPIELGQQKPPDESPESGRNRLTNFLRCKNDSKCLGMEPVATSGRKDGFTRDPFPDPRFMSSPRRSPRPSRPSLYSRFSESQAVRSPARSSPARSSPLPSKTSRFIVTKPPRPLHPVNQVSDGFLAGKIELEREWHLFSCQTCT